MSRPILTQLGLVMLLEPEPPSTCSVCGVTAECRPYGKDGANVCFGCHNIGCHNTIDDREAQKRFEARFAGCRTDVIAIRLGDDYVIVNARTHEAIALVEPRPDDAELLAARPVNAHPTTRTS